MLSMSRRRKLRQAGLSIDDISDSNIKKIAEVLELSEKKAREIIEECLEENELL